MPTPEPGPSLEHRVQRTGSFTLGLVLAAHTSMETGRDALFLANLPAEQLPFVYIAGAVLALGVSRVSGRNRHSPARRLLLLQALAATSIFGFWVGLGDPQPWLYYALYVWSGVITSVVVVGFWVLMADYFTVTQAKRHFAGIAMGGALGAVGGAGIAAAIAPWVPAETLLLVAVALFAASAVALFSLPRTAPPAAAPEEASGKQAAGLLSSLARIVRHPYARHVTLLVALAAAALTLGDYLFKSVLADRVAADQLPVWLSRVYLGLNLLSILVLAAGVTPLIRRLGVDRSLTLLPALLAIAGVGILAGLALSSVVLLKLADGTLRHSLHKTASEILYLPMDPRLRTSVKDLIDLVTHTAARALASLALLALTLLADPQPAIAGLLLLLSLLWMGAALRLRGPYLDVFRRTLRGGSIETNIDFPLLDIDSVSALVRALGHRDERVVLGAMDLLHERERCSLIPSLIFYHPSPEVVARAVDVFAAARRDEVLDFADRLLDHEYARVRSAIVRAGALLDPDRERLVELAKSSCPCIRVSAVSGLVAHGWIEEARAQEVFREALAHPEPDTRMAVANAAKLGYAPLYQDSLVALTRDSDPDVAREAVRAMQRSSDPFFTGPLVACLGDRRIRDLVRDALLERGDEALAVLARALESPDTPGPVLRHLPGTISRFPSAAALDTLLHGLEHARSGMVRYKILRGLQPLIADSPLRGARRDRIVAALRGTLGRTLHLLQHEVELVRGQHEDATRRTVGGRLLADLVRDKSGLATDRIFLLLSLLYPKEDFRGIRAGIRSQGARRQASSFELLEHLVSHDLRQQLVGLVSPGSAAERLRLASPARVEAGRPYAETVRGLARDPSEAVQAFAMYHASEIGVPLEPVHPAAPVPDEPFASGLREAALSVIERLPEALARGLRAGPTPAS